MAEFRMPSLGADMEAGTLVEWKIKPGDAVKRGDVVAEVVTEKGDIEIESWLTGTVEQLIVQPGQKVPVKTVMAIFRTNGEPPAVSPADAQAPAPEMPPPSRVSPPTPQVVQTPVAGHRVRISPAARKHAEAAGLDPGTITGTGPDGTVTIADVERVLATGAVPEETSAIRRAIARAMSRSKREIPHYYLTDTIDMTKVLAWLERENATRELPRRILYAALLLRAVALSVADVPEMNGTWVGEQWVRSDAVHIGVATSLRTGGLVAPAIHDVAAKSVDEVMSALRDLVERVRNGGLRSSELSDPTLTVTSLGRAIENPNVDILFHPNARQLGHRAAVDLDMDAVMAAAARTGTVLEINAQPDRLDLTDAQVRRARDAGVKLAINSDAHNTADLRFPRLYGLFVARRGWATRADVVNTLPVERLLAALKRRPAPASRRPVRKRRAAATA